MARCAEAKRETKETKIAVKVNLDGKGKAEIDTGVGFLDHMLTLLAVHSGFDIAVTAKGDVQVDFHHTVEDTAITLGKAFLEALGDKVGIERAASNLMIMEDSVVETAIDIGGRSSLLFDCKAEGLIGGFDCELLKVFYDGFTRNMLVNIYVCARVEGNKHHTAEAMFKGLARCLKTAVKITGDTLPSSKGSI